MKYLTLDKNGEFHLEPTKGNVFQRESTTIKFFSGLGAATVTFGCRDKAGAFSAYKDGVIDQDAVINHGAGAAVIALVENYSTEIKIGYTP